MVKYNLSDIYMDGGFVEQQDTTPTPYQINPIDALTQNIKGQLPPRDPLLQEIEVAHQTLDVAQRFGYQYIISPDQHIHIKNNRKRQDIDLLDASKSLSIRGKQGYERAYEKVRRVTRNISSLLFPQDERHIFFRSALPVILQLYTQDALKDTDILIDAVTENYFPPPPVTIDMIAGRRQQDIAFYEDVLHDDSGLKKEPAHDLSRFPRAQRAIFNLIAIGDPLTELLGHMGILALILQSDPVLFLRTMHYTYDRSPAAIESYIASHTIYAISSSLMSIVLEGLTHRYFLDREVGSLKGLANVMDSQWFRTSMRDLSDASGNILNVMAPVQRYPHTFWKFSNKRGVYVNPVVIEASHAIRSMSNEKSHTPFYARGKGDEARHRSMVHHMSVAGCPSRMESTTTLSGDFRKTSYVPQSLVDKAISTDLATQTGKNAHRLRFATNTIDPFITIYLLALRGIADRYKI